MTRRVASWACAALVLVAVAVAFGSTWWLSFVTGPDLAGPAPELELADASGEPVGLSALRGRRVVLLFAGTTCPGCPGTLAALRRWSEAHPEVAVIEVLLTRMDDLPRRLDEPFPQVLADRATSDAWRAGRVPAVVQVDEAGEVISSVRGTAIGPLLAAALDGRL